MIVSRYSIETLQAVTGPGGVEGSGSGLGSATGWLIGTVVVLLLVLVGWWSTTRERRR